MFWRTTVKEKQLPISKHNNQAKFPQGQLMCQLYPNVTWGKFLFIMRFGRQTVTWRSCTVYKERDRYCSRYQVLKHYSFSDIRSLKNIQGNLRLISKMHATVLNKCLPKKSMDSTVTRSTERAVRMNETGASGSWQGTSKEKEGRTVFRIRKIGEARTKLRHSHL